jgi:RNA polymerase sigma-70 factor (ECF subfamily)
MKVIERLNTFDGLGSFKSWLYTLCRHHCIDRLRYQARRPEITESEWRKDEDTKPTPIQNTVSREIAADEHAYDNELAQALNEALQKLPEEQRETFLLKERGGLTFEEIATAHQVSINTVKSRMRYALESLRRALKGKNFVKEALQ